MILERVKGPYTPCWLRLRLSVQWLLRPNSQSLTGRYSRQPYAIVDYIPQSGTKNLASVGRCYHSLAHRQIRNMTAYMCEVSLLFSLVLTCIHFSLCRMCTEKSTHKVHTCLEYLGVCPLVRIGIPDPLSRKRVCPSPGTQVVRGHTRQRVGGGEVPIRTTGEKS